MHTCCFLFPAALKVFVIPGTMRTCQKFLIRYNKQQLHRMLPKCKNKGKSDFVLAQDFFLILNLIESDIHFAEEEKEVRRAILSCSLTKEKKEFPSEESDEECDT